MTGMAPLGRRVAVEFVDTFAGIAPASVPPFMAAQLGGLVLGVVLVAVLFARPASTAGDVVVPYGEYHPAASHH
ncbi:hypothetical protein ACIGXM_33695 [Kitasatospora sp. NPDC052896]|uniref:hypothetical protein n=1 Tax=Kitasatospora sp. NPDC052896 TaxID=3364061 RepID=UPI0037C62460